jgi:hypothetical protein
MNTSKIDNSVLLEQLSAQYRLHTEQARAFLGFAATTVSVIVILFTGIFTISKDKPTLLILVPFSLISYAALIGLFFLYVNLNTLYCELIERKINSLLDDVPLFQYESTYVAYRDNKGEVGLHYVLVILAGLTPIAPTLYAIWLLGESRSTSCILQMVLLITVIFCCALVCYILLKVRTSRRKKNDQLLKEWQSKIRAASNQES